MHTQKYIDWETEVTIKANERSSVMTVFDCICTWLP